MLLKTIYFMGISCSGKKTSSIATPFFYSLALHLSLISFVLTLPAHSGSLNPLTLGSLFVQLRNDDNVQLEKSAPDSKQNKRVDLRTAQNITGVKNDEVVMSKISPDYKEKTVASKTFVAEDEKNHIAPPPDSKPRQENNLELVQSESRSAEIRGITAESKRKTPEAEGEQVEVITKEKPAMSASNAGPKDFSDTAEPARITAGAAKSDSAAGRDPSKRDDVLPEEKPVVPQPFQQPPISAEALVEKIPKMLPLQGETGKPVSEPEEKGKASRARLEKDKDKLIERVERLEARYELPASNPIQKTIHNKELKKEALSGKKWQGDSKEVRNKKSAIKVADSQSNKGAVKEAKSQDRDERYKNTEIAKASGTPMEIAGGGVSMPISSQQPSSGGVKPAYSASVGADTKGTESESEMKAAFAQQWEDSIRKDQVDKRGATQSERREAGTKDKKLGFSFPKAETPQLKDITVEVNLDDKETQSVSIRLSKKPYPATGPRAYRGKQENVKYAAETKEDLGASGIRHIFSIVKADHGIYTFAIDNKGNDVHVARIVFRLYEGRGRERIKEYENVQIQSGAVSRFKFIVPDAIFWDDKDRFSGEIESSKSVTKFNGSGLVWIEDKD